MTKALFFIAGFGLALIASAPIPVVIIFGCIFLGGMSIGILIGYYIKISLAEDRKDSLDNMKRRGQL